VAAASAFGEAAEGLHILDVARLHLGVLHSDFADLEGDEREHARTAEDALHHAVGAQIVSWMRATEQPTMASLSQIVAMSGGVDSAVALHEAFAAHDGNVAGVTLRLWIDPQAPDPEAACCSPDSVRRARAACHAIGVPHISLDLRGEFARSVVVPFVSSYAAGDTPNPCVGCNGEFRLDELVRCADVLGADTVATGHYVRTVQVDGVTLAQRGVDPRKDQSYMLCTLSPETLARFQFPLGARTKDTVRARAHELGLEAATQSDSQELCFLGGGDYRTFLERAQAMGTKGSIVSEEGEVLGEHDGIARFTPGQRRGLGSHMRTRPAAADPTEPLYVRSSDPESGNVLVVTRDRLRTSTVPLRDPLLHANLKGGMRVNAKLRYRSPQVAATFHSTTDEAWLELDTPVIAPAPGQIACFYDDDGVVLGAATIARV
jgi:tRNA-specific 2-thiouridylase